MSVNVCTLWLKSATESNYATRTDHVQMAHLAVSDQWSWSLNILKFSLKMTDEQEHSKHFLSNMHMPS
jgi:hypothetical protein